MATAPDWAKGDTAIDQKPDWAKSDASSQKVTPPVAEKEKPKEKTGIDRMKQFGESMLGGTVMGAAAPELTQLAGAGIGAIPSPYTRMAGSAIQSAGKAMRGERGLAAGAGAISGATGDVAGQYMESRGAGGPAVFAAEIAGGIVGPAFINTITSAVKYGARKLLGLDPISAIKTVASDLNINEKTLSPSQKKFIKDQIEQFRGAPATSAPQEKLHDILKTGATDITKQAERQAALAKQVGQTASSEAERKAEKMRLAGKKTTEIGEKALTGAQGERAKIGADVEPSTIGSKIREKVMSLFGDIANKRSAEYQAQKAIRDAAVAEKENAGTLVKDMPEYKSMLDDLRTKLLIGQKAQQQKTAPVTEKGVLQAYQNIYDAVSSRRVQVGVNDAGNPIYKTFPTSFDALDDVRRRLGDVAFGKEVEGYSAIGANVAKQYYSKISDIQSKFAGESHDALQSGYEMASKLLDKYKSRAGKKATAADRFDPVRFQTDPAALPNDYFSTKQSVSDLIELVGGDRKFVIDQASNFTARQLKNKDLKGVESWLDKNSDWISSLPEVKSKVDAYIQSLRRGERISGKSSEAAKILEAREPKVLREGEKATAEFEKQATGFVEEAQKRANTILGDRNPSARIKEIILGGKPSEWKEVGPILAANPQGKVLVADAVRQIMADRASTGLVSAVQAFRYDVAPSLKSAGLMTDSQLSKLESQLQAIANSAVGEPAKLTAMQNAIKNSIISIAAQPVGAATVGAAKAGKSLFDVLNNPNKSDR